MGGARFAFSGKAHSGKTTWARELARQHGDMVVLSFADAIKRHVAEIFGAPVEGAAKDRKLLQDFGSWCRGVDPDCWIRALWRRWEIMGKPSVVVDDLRFPNELEALLRAGYVLIRLEASERVREARAREMGARLYPDHPSETALDAECRWHYTFCTDSMDMDEVRWEIRRLLRESEGR